MPYIYVIEQENGLTKVGISSNPERRLASLQKISPKKLSIFAALPSPEAAAVEREVLSELRENIVVGEWLQVAPETAFDCVQKALSRHIAPDGEDSDTVTIHIDDYISLLEAREELALISARVNSPSNDESIPAAFVERMIDGESPLRVYRDLRAMTQAALADLSGVNRVQIADIEAGRKAGSISTLKKLASALGVTVDDLV